MSVWSQIRELEVVDSVLEWIEVVFGDLFVDVSEGFDVELWIDRGWINSKSECTFL